MLYGTGIGFARKELIRQLSVANMGLLYWICGETSRVGDDIHMNWLSLRLFNIKYGRTNWVRFVQILRRPNDALVRKSDKN